MRWLMEFKVMQRTRTPEKFTPENVDVVDTNDDGVAANSHEIQTDCCRLQVPQEHKLLGTINEMPESVEQSETVPSIDVASRIRSTLDSGDSHQADSSNSFPSSSCQTHPRKGLSPVSPKCTEISSSDFDSSNPGSTTSSTTSHLPPSLPPSSTFMSSSILPPPSTTDQEDALSADEGIQTSPPFETDDPWDNDESHHEITVTPTKRRYSMSAALMRSPRRIGEGDGRDEVKLRSPSKSWLAEEVKARRWRYRPKSCSLPHMDWLKQRTETALDRSAEMQRRTAELIQSAKSVRDQEV